MAPPLHCSALCLPSWQPGIPTLLLFHTPLPWLCVCQAAERGWSVEIPVAAQPLLPNTELDPLWLQDSSGVAGWEMPERDIKTKSKYTLHTSFVAKALPA